MTALYSEVMLDHFRHPRNYGCLPASDIAYEDLNPLQCALLPLEVLRSGVRNSRHRDLGE